MTASHALVAYFFIFAICLTVMLWAAASADAGKLEGKLEQLGQRAGEVGLQALWAVMNIGAEAKQAKAGGYYSDIEAKRHEQLPVLSSSVLDDERVLFLHEVELGTKRNFVTVDGNEVYVSRRHAKRIEEYLNFHPGYGRGAAKAFAQHGYALVEA